MKKIFFIAVMALTQMAIGQVKKNLGDFNEVKIFDRITLELVPSTENRVEITGSRSNDVEIVNSNGQLKIRMKLEQLLSGDDVTAVLYFKNIRSIDASEGSMVSGSKTINTASLEIIAKEGAQIKLDIDVKKADVKAVTGGIVTLSGKAANQNINIGTGGILEAKSLKTSQTTVKISAGGEARVNATELVDANIKAGGTVTIYGNPKNVNEKTVLGGSIIKVND